MNKPLIILDRDGVINHDSDDYIKSPAEWLVIESSLDAIKQLTDAGYDIAIATNQSALSREFITLEILDNIHKKMLGLIADKGGKIAAIEFCPDHPDNPGPNRKPAPGMLLKLFKQFNAVAEDTWFVGDTNSDINCAINAKCKPALVLTGKGTRTLSSTSFDNKVPVFKDLLDFTKFLLG